MVPRRLPCATVHVCVTGPVTIPPLIFVIDTFTGAPAVAVSVMLCHSCGVRVMRPGLLAP
jgi:hypothetical protein